MEAITHRARVPAAIAPRSLDIIERSPFIQPRPARRDRLVVVLLLALSVVLLFGRLPCGLLEPEEARYAEIARQMLLDGRWLTPVWHGEDYLHKPPLFYWLALLSYSAFGVHDWAARLIPCLAGVATVLVVYLWSRRFLGRNAALGGALVLLLSNRFLYLQGMVILDSLLCLWVTLALALGHAALQPRASRERTFGRTEPCSFSWSGWLASAVACGLGVLTKGLVAVALVGVPLLLLWRARRRRACPAAWRLGAAYGAMLLLTAGPWFTWLLAVHAGAGADFFWLHHVQRFAAPFDHAEPWWFFLPALALGLFPWNAWGLQAGAAALRRRHFRLGRAAFFWLAGSWCVLFFSLSGCKRAAYILPALPPLAAALGYHISRCRWMFAAAEQGRTITRRGLALFGALFLALALGTFAWLPAYHDRFGMREVLAPVQQLRNVPILACPRNYDSIHFYAGGGRACDGEQELLDALRTHDRAWLILRRRDAYPQLMRRWPADLEFHAQAVDHPNIVVGLVIRASKP